MAVEIVMPRMSDTMESGRIVRWLKNLGERVEKGEALAEIETDKAVMQLDSYEAGVIEKFLLAEDESAPIGEAIVLLGDGSGAGAIPSDAGPAKSAVPEAKVEAKPAPTSAAIAETRTATPVVESAQLKDELEHVSPTAGERVRASPLARRIAQEKGVDLARVHGSGPGGRIVSEDVEAFLATRPAAPTPTPTAPTAPAAPTPTPAPRPAPAVPPARPGEVVEFSRIRRAINDRLSESNATVPTFYVTVEIDMGAALALRAQINAAWAPDSVSVTDVIVRAAALALVKHPSVNSAYRPEGIERRAQVGVGVAVSLPDEALMVPVVREADRKSLREIGRETKGLIERARAGKPAAGDLGGASLSLSNLGMYDVEDFVAIITPPESAILAIGSTREVPAVVDGEVRIAKRMRVTLSGDHRVFAGETAAKFMKELKRLLQSPLELLQ